MSENYLKLGRQEVVSGHSQQLDQKVADMNPSQSKFFESARIGPNSSLRIIKILHSIFTWKLSLSMTHNIINITQQIIYHSLVEQQVPTRTI